MEALVPREKLNYMVNYYNDYEKVIEDINSVKEQGVDLIVLYMHWGMNTIVRQMTSNKTWLRCWQRKVWISSSGAIPMLFSLWNLRR